MSTIRYITRFDKDYPSRLSLIDDPPAGIYLKGELPDENAPAVAIIGSRNCSEYGAAMATKFAKDLTKAGVIIISGMALGIDGIAQRSAVLEGGKTYGVLGCGIDVVYPKMNCKLFEEVENIGGLISEYPPGTMASPFLFPPRNRIISALSDVVLVIEAKKRSGTSITVNRALEQGKDVFAVPGRIYDKCSEGCNELISQGAGIATSPNEILKALGIYKEDGSGKCKDNLDHIQNLSDAEKKVLKFLEQMSVTPEYLQIRTGLKIPELMEALMKLQIKGICKEVAAGEYVIITH